MTWADDVAEAFGLPDVVRAVEHTYRSSPTWRFETVDGAYLVKAVPAEWRLQLEAANAFEHRAAAAGLPMPTPVDGRSASSSPGPTRWPGPLGSPNASRSSARIPT